MKHTCDCRVTEHVPSPEELELAKESFERTGEAGEPRMDIEYCPLHAAAPALLEALIRAGNWIGGGAEWLDADTSNRRIEAARQVRHQIDAAIEEAKGA